MTVPGTIHEVYEKAAAEHGHLPHLIFPEGGVSTYADTLARARRLAGLLQDAGIQPGDRVTCLLGNCRALYEFYLASSLAGVIAVPINTQSTGYEISRLLEDCTPRACIADAKLLAGLKEDPFDGLSFRCAANGEYAGWHSYEDEIAQARSIENGLGRPDDPVLIVYSSGTTGAPKGIVLRQSGVIGNALRVMERLEHGPNDRFITLLPSFHTFGYNFEFIKPALVHSPVVVMPAFDAERALTLIERYKVTVLHAVPTMIARIFDAQLLAKHDVTSIRMVYTGGGPVSPELKRYLKEDIGIAVSEGYGMTECSAGATIQPLRKDLPYASCGPALRDFEVKIVDSEDHEVPVGESGEIVMRCPTFMVGYWNQPELTAQTLRGGWLHSGDVGKLDAEGNLYILDRLKDMLVSNGFNVFPKEVENAVLMHPAVQLAGVVGIPDEIRGDTIHAFVTLKGGEPANGRSLDELAAEILQDVRTRLAHYKWPRSINIVRELPLTATGKVRRFKLREMRSGGDASESMGGSVIGRAGDALVSSTR